ncbi:MAG: Rieske 2Fe-2S domain-containing protein [Nitrososphaeria archaeon]|jgi:nitrite reductase/ring-hydroxylating ferredoxin subunit
MTFVKAAKTVDVPTGKMKHVEVEGKEIMIANVEGKFYAASDRCGHMNARLSMGILNKTIVICSYHFSRFDLTTGRLVSGPVPTSTSSILGSLPENVKKMAEQMQKRTEELQSAIKTYDLQTYQVKVEGEDILINA